MAYATTAASPHQIPAARRKTGRGLFSRLLAAMQEARMRQAEREIAHYLADTGGKFTDEAEREIERRYLSNSSSW
jgi:hypothetical protein